MRAVALADDAGAVVTTGGLGESMRAVALAEAVGRVEGESCALLRWRTTLAQS